jgi:crotonobetainyl-CoA:carnitine CoA-transferase CaiB-like acyl-CoA transferase
MATGPLSGVRVLEFTQIIAGPFGCQFLSDLGAEVMKVEPVGGEPWRLTAQFVPLESKTYQALNRGKRSIAIDLTDAQAQAAIHELVKTVEVVVINYRPDVAKRLCIDYETLSAIKPDLVYVDSTAFGREGPWAQKPGYDIVAQGVSGLTAAGARFDERGVPILPSIGMPVADVTTGYAIAMGTCAALYHRSQTGEGQLVQTSLLANALMAQSGSFMSLPAGDTSFRTRFEGALAEGRGRGATYTELAQIRRSMQQGRQAGNIYYRNYLTSDGAIAIGNLSASLRKKMRDALGIEYDARDDDPEYDPLEPQYVELGQKLIGRVEKLIASNTTAHWVQHFEAAGVPVGEILFPEELLDHPQVVANGYRVELEHDLTGPQVMAAPPLKMSKTPPAAQGAAPPLGRDTDAILGEAGLSAAAITELREAGAIR